MSRHISRQALAQLPPALQAKKGRIKALVYTKSPTRTDRADWELVQAAIKAHPVNAREG